MLPSVKNQPVPGGSGSSSITLVAARNPVRESSQLARPMRSSNPPHSRTSTEASSGIDLRLDDVERSRRGPRHDGAVSDVDTAVARALELLALAVPLDLTAKVGARGRHGADAVMRRPRRETPFRVRARDTSRSHGRPPGLLAAGSPALSSAVVPARTQRPAVAAVRGPQRERAQQGRKAAADESERGVDEDDEGAAAARRGE